MLCRSSIQEASKTGHDTLGGSQFNATSKRKGGSGGERWGEGAASVLLRGTEMVAALRKDPGGGGETEETPFTPPLPSRRLRPQREVGKRAKAGENDKCARVARDACAERKHAETTHPLRSTRSHGTQGMPDADRAARLWSTDGPGGQPRLGACDGKQRQRARGGAEQRRAACCLIQVCKNRKAARPAAQVNIRQAPQPPLPWRVAGAVLRVRSA